MSACVLTGAALPTALFLSPCQNVSAATRAKIDAIQASIATLQTRMQHMQDTEAKAQTELDAAVKLLDSTLGPQVCSWGRGWAPRISLSQ